MIEKFDVIVGTEGTFASPTSKCPQIVLSFIGPHGYLLVLTPRGQARHMRNTAADGTCIAGDLSFKFERATETKR